MLFPRQYVGLVEFSWHIYCTNVMYNVIIGNSLKCIMVRYVKCTILKIATMTIMKC